jgi:phage gp29-like protein
MPDQTPALVDARGRPLRAPPAVLRQEIAAPTTMGVRSIISGHPAQGLTPGRLAALLRGAEQGDAIAYLELAEEMEEKDLHYLSVLGTRKRQVAQLPITVEPAGESAEEKADAQLVQDWLDRDLLEAELFDILDAVGKGLSATEIIWEFSETAWLPAKLKWRDPRFFELDQVTGEELLLRDVGPSTRLPPAKFLVHFHQAKSGIPIRGGIARAVAWGYMFKNYAIKDWVAFLETYGMPLRVGKYDNGESTANIQTLLDALAQLGSDAAAAFPRTMDVEFIDGKAGTAPNDLWRSMAEYIDDQVSKVVLGQTNTTDAKAGGLGSGQAQVHNDVRGDIERADAKLLAATLNEQLVKPIVMLNRGPRLRYPRIKIGRPDEVDVAAMVSAVTALVPLGVEISAEDVRERAGLPAPKPGAKLLASAQAAQEPPDDADGPEGPEKPARRLSGALRPSQRDDSGGADGADAEASAIRRPIADPIDAAIDETLGDWEQLLRPVIAPVEAVIASASSLENLRGRVVEAIASMEVEELTELLARSCFGARLAGDVDAGPADG